MNNHKIIYLLIGAKGSGKSFIGGLFEQYFHIHFVRVEDWAKKVKKGRKTDDENYVKEFFKVTENGIRSIMNEKDAVVFESTGLSLHFDAMLAHLRSTFRIIPIRIRTDPELCITRFHSRDADIHIDVSENEVRKINKAVEIKNFTCDYEIENSSASREDLVEKIQAILIKTCPGKTEQN